MKEHKKIELGKMNTSISIAILLAKQLVVSPEELFKF